MAAATPVVILTGALGAGKTTLLNAALRGGQMPRTAVVVNEFGSIGIDHELVAIASDEVVLLPGGCACCEMRSGLAEALLRLERGARTGELRRFARIVVETSGLADPGPVLGLLAESPLLFGRFRPEAVVTVVDAVLGDAALDQEGTARTQVLLADRLVINKWEALPQHAVAQLEARLAALNPYAERVRASRSAADAAWFGAAAINVAANALPRGGWRAAHDDAVDSFVLRWDEAQPLEAIGDWLQRLAASHGARLLRVKGIVAAADCEQAVAVHAIQHLVAPPEFLDAAPNTSRVVFITRGLEPGDVAPEWPVAAS